jgi:hypothetical protein
MGIYDITLDDFYRLWGFSPRYYISENGHLITQEISKPDQFDTGRHSSLSEAKIAAYHAAVNHHCAQLQPMESHWRSARVRYARLYYSLLNHSDHKKKILEFREKMDEHRLYSTMNMETFFSEHLRVVDLPNTFKMHPIIPKGAPLFLLRAHNLLQDEELTIQETSVCDLSLHATNNPDIDYSAWYTLSNGLQFTFNHSEKTQDQEIFIGDRNSRLFTTKQAASRTAYDILKKAKLST